MTDANATETDRELIRRVLDGDVDCFAVLMERHAGVVRAVANGRVPRQDVRTMVHDVFVDAYRSLPSYAGKSPFAHWLTRIAVFKCCDFWRHRGTDRNVLESTLGDDHRQWLDHMAVGVSQQQFARDAGQREAHEILEHVFHRLAPEDRMLMDLYYLQSWHLKDVAKAMGWSLPKAKIRAWRARRALRAMITEMLEGEKQ